MKLAKSNYIPTLDGWRALAVTAVMLFHLPPFIILGHSLGGFQSRGVLGVEVFFVISGFLICTRLLQEETQFGKISLRNFYTRRLFRIQPAAFFFLATLLVLALMSTLQVAERPFVMSVLAVRNYYPKILWEMPGATYTNHFWSLAVEEHFYLIIPVLLVFIPRQKRIKALFILYAISFGWARLATHWHLTDNRTDVSFELLMLPALLAVMLASNRYAKPSGKVFLAYCGTISALLYLTYKFFHGAAAGPIIHFLIVGCVFGTALTPSSLPSRLLELKPLRFIGRISYSIYLWQQLFCKVPDPAAASGHLLLLQRPPYYLLATLGCALASYYLIEKPFIRLGHRFAPSPSAQGREVDKDVQPSTI